VTLAAGRLELSLAPLRGGSIVSFNCLDAGRKIPVLRGCDGAPEHILDAACFPLVPFANRVRDGRFSFRHHNVTLARNLRGEPSPLHGQGWLAPWKMLRSNSCEAELAFEHEPGEWPWRYQARQSVSLRPDGLTLRLSCRNLSPEPMPCGLGHHPYFPCTEATRLDTRAAHLWSVDEKRLPLDRIAAAGRFDLEDRSICGQNLDHCFEGWSGRARIADPFLPFEIELASPDARWLQLYAPPEGGFFAAEPVSHAPAALNRPEQDWPALGLRVLAPGEDMSLTMWIAVSNRARAAPR
jgi:aldose 1-epimerase